MRLPFSTFFALSTSLLSLFPLFVSAIHPHALSRHGHQRSPASSVLTSRQHRVPRDLLDLCINANVNLLTDLSHALGGLLGPLGLGTNIQLCLCLKDLDIYLQTNDQIQALVGLLGIGEVKALVSALINTSPKAQHCTFPEHAHHTCTTTDPCHYDCDPGYIKDSTGQCVCAPPNITCNGVCGSFPHGCGSAVPRSAKLRREKIRTLAQAKALCKPHESVCGIPGRENSFDFECIDTTKSSGSCGGCVTPHPFLDDELVEETSGSDCDAVPNAERTVCSNSRCIVNTCTEGWTPSADNSECVGDRAIFSRVAHLSKRAVPIVVGADANATVGGSLVTQLVAVLDLVLGLPPAPPSSPSTPSSPSGSPGYVDTIGPLLNDVQTATDALLKSADVAGLLFNIDVLFDTLGLLHSNAQHCHCEDALGLPGLILQVEKLLALVGPLQEWCAHNPISAPASAPTSTLSNNTVGIGESQLGSPGASSILVGLSDLINRLGLLGPSKAGAAVSGLGSGINDPVNGLLSGLGIGPSNYKRRDTALNANITANVTLNSAILVQLNALVDSVTDLHGLFSSLPATASNILKPVLDSSAVLNLNQAVAQLLHVTDVPTLLASVEAIVAATVNLGDGITGCGCLEKETLHLLDGYLARLLEAAANLQGLCAPISAGPAPSASNSVPSPSSPLASSPAATSGVPIIVALDKLLAGLGLGGTKVDATVSGLGDGLSGLTDDILNDVDIGPDGLQPRQITANATVDADVSLLNDLHASGLIDALLKLVLDLNSTHASLPESPSSSVDPNLINGLVNATTSLALGSIYADVVAETASIVAESALLLKALEAFADLEALGLGPLYAYAVKVVDAALALQGWCHDHPTSSPPPHSPPPPPTTSHPSAPPPSTTQSEPPTSTHTSVASPPSATDEPIIIGLTKTLHGLGLDVDADVVVDGLLGNNLDHLVNSITDSLGIGPNGVRRRFARE